MANKCTNDIWKEKNKNYTPGEAKEFIESLAEKYRNKIFEYKKLK